MTSLRLVPADSLPVGGTLADARRAVASTLATTADSEVAKARILEFVDDHPDALHRTCTDGHLTGSALVVDDDRERMLVLLHVKLGRWLQPGGHADGEGHLGTVALTEAWEETGVEGLRLASPAVDCDIHVIPVRGGEPEHLHLDVRFVILAPAGAVIAGNHESHDLRWVTSVELEQLAGDDSLVRLARSGIEVARTLP